ncbi:MAG: hypothetical protein AAGE76_12465 [Pseudomonadota bacterium]
MQDMDWLLQVNRLARRFGDGLKPELEALLARDARHRAAGVVPLPVTPRSSGPVSQTPPGDDPGVVPFPRAEQPERTADTA